MTAFCHDIDNAIIMGDFNFDDKKNYHAEPPGRPLENLILTEIAADYQDLWAVLNRDASVECGYTFDNKGNTMFPPSSLVEQARYNNIQIHIHIIIIVDMTND